MTITNPLEVVKTRLQLQGELQPRSHNASSSSKPSLSVSGSGSGSASSGSGSGSSNSKTTCSTSINRISQSRVGVMSSHIPKPGLRGASTSAAAATVGATVSGGGSAGVNRKVYSNVFSAMWVIMKTEGLAGIQRGLVPAYAYQGVMNGTRLGSYEPIKNALTNLFIKDSNSLSSSSHSPTKTVYPLINVTAGLISGVIGAFVGSPLFLVKTRMQSYSSSSAIAVGHQHYYKGTGDALYSIWRQDGIRGLFRGCGASMMRTGVGSAVQLSCYDQIKHFLLSLPASSPALAVFGSKDSDVSSSVKGKQPKLFDDTLLTHLMSSVITGFFVCVCMNPFDVVSTRLYNQHVSSGKGSLYAGPFDCMKKTVQSEGIAGLYKGFGAHWLRIGPHTVLTFIFLEQLKSLAAKYWV